MKTFSLISIVIPCYNQSQFLAQTLLSVYVQSYQKWECLIIDDGSTDGCKVIAMQWCELDNRFKYFYKKNGGLSSARNYGLDRVNGDIIQLLDADDLIRSDKLELQLKDLLNHKVSISNYYPFDNENFEFVSSRYLTPFLDEFFFKSELIIDWEFKKSIPCHSVLFHSSLIKSNNLRFDESLENHEDWVFWVKLFDQVKTIYNRNDLLAFYRIHDLSMTSDYFKMRQGFLKATLELKDHFSKKENKILKNLTIKKYKKIKRLGKSKSFYKLAKRVYRKLKSLLKSLLSNVK